MATLKILPHQNIIDGFRGKIDFYLYHPTCDPESRGEGIAVARKWPRSPGHLRSAAVMAQWPLFTEVAQSWATLSDTIKGAWKELASGTTLTGKDLYTRYYITGSFTAPSP
jgi:hypothetical protein